MATKTTTYQLQTLTCPSCITKIEKAVSAQPDVESAEVMFSSSKVKVTHEAADSDNLKQTIEKLGYEVLSEK